VEKASGQERGLSTDGKLNAQKEYRNLGRFRETGTVIGAILPLNAESSQGRQKWPFCVEDWRGAAMSA